MVRLVETLSADFLAMQRGAKRPTVVRLLLEILKSLKVSDNFSLPCRVNLSKATLHIVSGNCSPDDYVEFTGWS